MADKKKGVKRLLKKGADATGAAVGALVGSSLIDVLGTGGAAALSQTIQSALSDMINKFLSDKEENRIGVTARVAIETINKKLEDGDNIRDDDFFVNDLSGVEEIFEGCLMVAKNSHEEVKAIYLGYLFANICFDETVTKELANQLIYIANQLTYGHLCIIKYYADSNCRNLISLPENAFYHNDFEDIRKYGVLQQIRQLENFALLTTNSSSFELNHIVAARVRILRFGSVLYQLMQLNEIPDEDIIKVLEPIKRGNI